MIDLEGASAASRASRKPAFRTDIQALRGFAVLAVVLYHAGVPWFHAGYLGVDMFFVVSGFLITRIVNDHLKRGDFSFRGFYARRIRRLIPALYVVLLGTTLAAAVLLTSAQVDTMWSQLTGALMFATNIVLWRQINYFNTSAAFEPLLHLWSLAIEEQYYLLLPPLLMIVPARFRLATVTAVTVTSAVLYALLASRSPGATFYLLPTRAWELGIGSLGSFAAGRPTARRWARVLFLPSIAALLVVPLVPFDPLAFNPGAIGICGATLVIMLARSERLAGLGPTRVLARVGDISYSLYLVHWPLFAITHSLYLTTDLPVGVAALLVIASLLLAEAMFRGVEEPLRRSYVKGVRLLAALALGSVLVFGTATVVWAWKRAHADARVDLAGVTGLPGCAADLARFDPANCTTGPAPHILIWGDSFSQHIMPGVLATTARPLVQASKGHCGAFANLAPMEGSGDRRFAEGCLAFNRSVLDYLRNTPSIRVVAISNFYPRYIDPRYTMLRTTGAALAALRIDERSLIAAQTDTAAAIRAMGRRVVVVSGPPLADYDVGLCWSRRIAGLPLLGSRQSCTIGPDHLDPLNRPTLRLMDRFAATAATPVIRLDAVFCPARQCVTALASTPLYRDNAHMSHAGSLLVGRQLALGERIWREAR